MAVAVAVAVSGGVAVPAAVPVAVPVAGLTKRFFNQKDFLINVWGYFVCVQNHDSLNGIGNDYGGTHDETGEKNEKKAEN